MHVPHRLRYKQNHTIWKILVSYISFFSFLVFCLKSSHNPCLSVSEFCHLRLKCVNCLRLHIWSYLWALYCISVCLYLSSALSTYLLGDFGWILPTIITLARIVLAPKCFFPLWMLFLAGSLARQEWAVSILSGAPSCLECEPHIWWTAFISLLLCLNQV